VFCKLGFSIVREPAKFWDKIDPSLHHHCLRSGTIWDERDMDLPFEFDNVGNRVRPARNLNRIKAFLETYKEIEDSDKHTQLREDFF
jgi:hypothetical protein